MSMETSKAFVLVVWPDALAWWDEELCAIRIPRPIGNCIVLENLDDDGREFFSEPEAWASAAAVLKQKESQP